MTTAQDEILKGLTAIKKKLSAPTAVPLKPSTYADSARLAMAYSTHDKPVPSRTLKELLVKVVEDPKLSRTSGRLVESINAAHSSRADKVLAA